MARLTHHQRIVLELIAMRQPKIDSVSEPFRQRAIDLGMMEPPLVETDGPRLVITPAGRTALQGGGDG